jgi:hypothetical protein
MAQTAVLKHALHVRVAVCPRGAQVRRIQQSVEPLSQEARAPAPHGLPRDVRAARHRVVGNLEHS